MRRAGIGIPIRDAENDVTEGIKTLSSYLSMGDLKICRNCRNLIGEIQGYCWDPKAAERGEDAPIKRADQAIDALRYSVFSYFGNRISMKEPIGSLEGASLGRLKHINSIDPRQFKGAGQFRGSF